MKFKEAIENSEDYYTVHPKLKGRYTIVTDDYDDSESITNSNGVVFNTWDFDELLASDKWEPNKPKKKKVNRKMKPETILKKLKAKPLIVIEDEGTFLNYLTYVDGVSDGFIGFINRLIHTFKAHVNKIKINCWVDEYNQCARCGHVEGDMTIYLYGEEGKDETVESLILTKAEEDDYVVAVGQIYFDRY